MARTCQHALCHPTCASCIEEHREELASHYRRIPDSHVGERSFRREVLGEFVLQNPDRVYPDHAADVVRYSRARLRALGYGLHESRELPPAPAGKFLFISPMFVGTLEPTAVVLFDRDLAHKVANPVFVTRWGHLYVATPDDPDVCWCWDDMYQRWDDLSGGVWGLGIGAQWSECLDEIRSRRSPDR